MSPSARELLLHILNETSYLLSASDQLIDFLPAVNGGDSFYAAHGDASAIGWVGASQPATTKAVDLCAAPRPF